MSKEARNEKLAVYTYSLDMCITGLKLFEEKNLAEYVEPVCEFLGAQNMEEIEEIFDKRLWSFYHKQRRQLTKKFLSLKEIRCKLGLPMNRGEKLKAFQTVQLPQTEHKLVNEQLQKISKDFQTETD